MEERLYLFLGLFFVTIPVFAEPTGGLATGMIISAGVGLATSIFGGVSAGAAKRRAQRKERAAAGQRMALEANRQDIPTFGQEFENPYSNLQVATRASEIQAEQADISLASTLDTLRATGASAGGATALARAAAQSKRGVSASIEQQEARNAQLRAQGEVQAAQMRQRAEMASFQAQERRETQQLNRQASLESSFNQQAAAYGAQSSQMIGQAVGALGTFAAQGGFGKSGPFAGKNTTTDASQYDFTKYLVENTNPQVNTNNNVFMPGYNTRSSFLNNNSILPNYLTPNYTQSYSQYPSLLETITQNNN